MTKNDEKATVAKTSHLDYNFLKQLYPIFGIGRILDKK